METFFYVLSGLIGTALCSLVIWFAASRIRQRLRPREERERDVLRTLSRHETATGATYVHRGLLSGITPEDARGLAESAGYRYTGRDGYHLTFQRRLSGQE